MTPEPRYPPPGIKRPAKFSLSALGLSLAIHIAFLSVFAFNLETEMPEPQIIFPVTLVSESALAGKNTSATGDKEATPDSSGKPSPFETVEKKADTGTPPEEVSINPPEETVRVTETTLEETAITPTPPPAEMADPPEFPMPEKTTPEITQVTASPPVETPAPEIKTPTPKPETAMTAVETPPPPLPLKKPPIEQKKKEIPAKTAKSTTQEPVEKTPFVEKVAYQEPPAKEPLSSVSGKNFVSADGLTSSTKLAALDTTGAPDTEPGFNGHGLSNPAPKYPYRARQLGQEGRVVLRVQVDASGRVTDITLHKSSGHRRLDTAAIKTVRKWKFVPATRRGIKVAGVVEVPVRFSLEN